MPREFDHLVLCVHDLDAAQRQFQSLGFTVTPPRDHPFGTRNRLVLLEDNFLELLTVADAGAIPPATPGRFSFGAHNQAFLARNEGLSMLAFKGNDARADVHQFAAQGIDTYEPFDFSRAAVLPDGRPTRVAFSLAFATDARLPGVAFFTCQHHQPRDLLGQPEYRRHANGAGRIVEVILSAPDPTVHRQFFEPLTGTDAIVAPGMLSVGPPDNRLTLLNGERLADRFPECAPPGGAPRFAACRIAVADLGTLERQFQADGIPHRAPDGAIVVAPADAFGMAIEFASRRREG
jgi:hypothetical protein